MLLLHLSDIHFKKSDYNSPMDVNQQLRQQLVSDASAMCRKLGKKPDVIIISGDIAYAADPAEYDFAKSWLNHLCSACGVPLSSLFIIPGNHDVNRDITSSPIVQALHKDIKNTPLSEIDIKIKGLLEDQNCATVLYSGLSAYNNFAGDFSCKLVPPNNTTTKRDVVLSDNRTVTLWGLNSAFISSKHDKKNEIFVDPSYNQIISNSSAINIVVCHHPYSWIKNSENLRRHLNDTAIIHIFGHEHTNRIFLGTDYVEISASAVMPDRQEGDYEPGYNLIELNISSDENGEKLFAQFHIREWQKNPGRFRAKQDRQGNDTFKHSFDLPSQESLTWIAPYSTVATSSPHQRNLITETILDMCDNEKQETNYAIKDFFELPTSQRHRIAGLLSLVEENDNHISDLERANLIINRVASNNLLNEFNVLVSKFKLENGE